MGAATGSVDAIGGRPLVRHLDALCDRFEAAWHAGPRPRIEDFLDRATGPDRTAVVRELLALELELRLIGGERPRREEYLERLREYADEVETVFDEASPLPARQAPGASTRPGGPTISGSGDTDPGPGPEGEVDTDPDPDPEAAPRPKGRLPVLPGYEVLGLLGRGGMGIVYLARQVRLNRRCALKMIVADADDPEVLIRFLAEAETVARLDHPNVVRIYRIGDHDGRPFLELEYLDGGSLSRRLDGTPWPPHAASALVERLAEATAAAHERGIIHRDLKPSNILLEADGNPKVADFGVAKCRDVDAGLTRTGAIVGTPSYMAPEQAMGRPGEVGPSADIYSLGAILYELLTGRPPFKASTVLETLEQVKGTEPVPPSRLQPGLPRDVETIALKCLAKDPSRRYGSASDLADDLRRSLEGRPIRARRAGPTERAGRWCRRNPWLAAAAGAVAASLLSVAALSIRYATKQAEARVKTDRLASQLEGSLEISNRRLSVISFEHGMAACERGDLGPGLLWLAEALRTADADDHDWRRLVWLNLAAWRATYPGLKALFSHTDPVQAVAFSPDGRKVLTGCSDGELRLWDVTTGRPTGPTFERRGPVTAVAFSPDGESFLVSDTDCTTRFCDAATGRPVGPTLTHSTQVNSAAYSPDGRSVITGAEGGTASLWDVASGRELLPAIPHKGAVRAVAFSGDGESFAVATGQKVELWHAVTGKPVREALTFSCDVYALSFGPRGKTLLAGTGAWFGRLRSVKSGKPVGPTLGHQGRVASVAFSPDGRTALTGSWDRTARLWNVLDGQPIGPPLSHHGRVTSVAFSPDGRTALTGSRDRTARLWEVAAAPPVVLRFAVSPKVSAIAYSPDGKTFLTGGDEGTAQLWDAATGRPIGPSMKHGDRIGAAAFSPDRKTALTGSDDGTVQLLDAATGRPLTEPLRHRSCVNAVAFSPDGKTIFTWCDDRTSYLWDASTGEPAGPPILRKAPVSCVAFSPDGKTFVTGDQLGEVQRWDVATRRQLGLPMKHQDWVSAVSFSPDGRMILTGSHDGEARLWDAATGRRLGLPLIHTGSQVFAVAFSPDGRTILTGGKDFMVRLWDVATRRQVGPPIKHRDWVYAAAFSPDGRSFVTPSGIHPLSPRDAPRVPDDDRRVQAWLRTITGLAMDDFGVIRSLENGEWQESRRLLDALGGPPEGVEGR